MLAKPGRVIPKIGATKKKIEATLAQQFDFVSQAMHIARASRDQSVQSSPKRKASSDKVFFDGVPYATLPWFLGKVPVKSVGESKSTRRNYKRH